MSGEVVDEGFDVSRRVVVLVWHCDVWLLMCVSGAGKLGYGVHESCAFTRLAVRVLS